MLSEFVRRQILSEALTVDQVCRRASYAGHRISPAYLRKILNDTVGTISVEIAEALSIGLGVSLHEVIDAALKHDTTQTPSALERLVAVYHALNTDQRIRIDPLLEVVRREMLRLLDETQQAQPPALPRELS